MRTIVSLTSYPDRYDILDICLNSIISQRLKPERIILNIVGRDVNLPIQIIDLHNLNEIEIEYLTLNLKPHNKYYHVMNKYPDDIIITFDDDAIYPQDITELLVEAHLRFPHSVIAGKVHIMKLYKRGRLSPYLDWDLECSFFNTPSFDLFATGVGGVLYPPRCMSEKIFDAASIKRLCLYQDDIWSKYMQLLEGTKVVLIKQTKPCPPLINDLTDAFQINLEALIEV